MKMSFVNKFENQGRFIEAFIQENWHPAPKPVKITFDKNPNFLLPRLPPTGIKPNSESQINSSFPVPSPPCPVAVLPFAPVFPLPPGWQSTPGRWGRKEEVCPSL